MSNFKQKNGVILARVSSRSQEIEGYSLDAQLKFLRAYAEKNNIKIIKEYKIAETASKASERRAFHECLTFIKKNKSANCLLIEKVDRALRNLKDLAKFDEWVSYSSEREIHCVKDNMVIDQKSRSQDKFMWGIKVLMAKNFADNLSEEVKKGQMEKLAQGWLPNRPPIGYKTIKEDGKNIHILDEEIAPLVKKAFETYAKSGETILSVTDKARKWGLKTLNNREMTKTCLDKMLDNKFYIGINVWNDVEYVGAQEKLISDELWEAVQVKKHGGDASKPKFKKHNALFRGLIRCSECGKLIVWQKQKGRYYGRCNKSCGNHPYAREDGILDAFKGLTSRFKMKNDKVYDWISDSIVGYAKSENDKIREERDAIQNTLKREKTKLETLYDDKLDGIISTDDYIKRSSKLKIRVKELENDLKKYDVSIESVSEVAIKLVAICRQINKCFDEGDNDIKREIIEFAFKNPIWDGKKLTAELSECAELVLSFAESVDSGIIKVEPPSDPCKKDPLGSSCCVWQGWQDLNSRHAVLETAALPTELHPYILKFYIFILPQNVIKW